MSDDATKSFETLLRLVAAAPEVPIEFELVVGMRFADRYRVLERLGRGAMGIVYRVSDEELGEEVALKLLDPRLSSDPAYQASLRTEVRLARRVSHPNVCRVHDLGVVDEKLFVTMELLSSETLRPRIDQSSPLPLARRIDILVQVASGLAAAHRAGVIHGDIKPDNVILDGERAVITDFGVASLTLGAAPTLAGTPAYMAPELLTGRPSDRRIDTYSFGVLAFELLSGARPFDVDSIASAMAAAEKPLPRPALPPSVAAPEVREALDAVIRCALETDPTRRPDPIDRLATMLSRAAAGEGPERARRATPTAIERTATALVARLPEPLDPSRRDSLERPISAVGGLIISVDDTAIEALFGAPRSLGDDAIRAARAALALGVAFPHASVAIHTGRVRLHESEGGPRAAGQALDVARELTRAGGVVCSRSTRAQLGGHFELESRGRAVRIADRPAGGAPIALPLCGRTVELDRLETEISEAFRERRTRFVRLTGPPGIGKTRLVDELLARLNARREVDVVTVRAAPYADLGALALLRQAVPGAERPEELRQWLLEKAARRPLVFVADDLQWADAPSRAFLADLERLDEVALVGLFITRDAGSMWPAPTGASSDLALGGLPDAAARSLVLGIAPVADEAAVNRAVERAAGNPFLLEELGRALREGRDALPDTAIAAAQEQLDQLVELSRDIVRRAAVLGSDISPVQLATITEGARGESMALDAALGDLIERGILVARADPAGTLRYQFTSALVREVAYEMTGFEERARWHAAAAGGMEALAASDSGRSRGVDLATIAGHWERAGDRTRARTAYHRAGSAALARFAFVEAADSLRRAADLADPDTLDVELLTELGQALEHSDGAAAAKHFERAFAATRPGDSIRPRLCLYLGRRAAAGADNGEARTWYERGLDELGDPPDGPDPQLTTRAALYANLGSLLGYIMSDNQRGLELSARAVALLEGTDHRRELADALSRLGGNYMRAGRWRDQLDCNRRHLEIAQELGDLAGEVTARINLGEVHKSLGELDLAFEHTRAALALCARIGNSVSRALAVSNLGLLLLERGDLRAAEERLTRSIELGTRVGYSRHFYESYAGLSRVHYLYGELERAEELARSAVGVAIASGSEISEGIALRFLAAARAARGSQVEALAHIRRAHRCLAQRDECEEARTAVVESRILAARAQPGDAELATARLEAARETFRRLGAAGDLARIDDLSDLR